MLKIILEVDLINLDSTSTQTLQKECKLLNVKLDYFTEGNRKSHAMYDKCMQKAKNVQNELDTCEKQNKRNDIVMIERLNDKITVLTSEVKLLQSDKESGKLKFSIVQFQKLSFSFERSFFQKKCAT